MYYTFSNQFPFTAMDEKELISEIQNKQPEFSEKAWQKVPEEARALLEKMLSKDPKRRPSAWNIVRKDKFLRAHRNGEPIGGEGRCCSVQ